ncbi:hypothetical protein EDD36DRAFT_455110 [Exophiala viscosa]|uniref:Hydantoinase/oxoprolinase n=1 Tax=Exophiala viscosa TaxID=2486360 RepID=A0AAN6IIK2_9EURO|nr:hypothetical protein EDD36DRAFT_455110 [Exophiala viscosa]
MSFYRIGVDVGGTNTDAAILDITAYDEPGRGVLASHKAPTTPDITSGIEAAIEAVLKASKVDQTRVSSVTIGTTHFINALVEADSRRLDRVAVVRLCGPFTRQIPPFSDFPVGLRSILDGGSYYLPGGFEIDGRSIAPLDHEQITAATKAIVAAGIRAVAIIGVFSPLDYEGSNEADCERLILSHAPGLQVACSNNIGPIGFMERENATILNAAILNTAHKVTKGFKRAMCRLGLTCPLFLSQNDGTIIDVDTAAEYPIKTFASGPTNSMIGAAFLAGLDTGKQPNDTASDSNGCPQEPQVLVVDIGGTTTDVCALLPSGFPRPAPGFVEVGGVRTAFSIPEVASIGLGGGSLVEQDPCSLQDFTVGPTSVGHAIQREALVFGGRTLTATDIVVAAAKVKLGDETLVQSVPRSTIQKAQQQIKKKLEIVIDAMKVSQAPVHVLLVGGGAMLAPPVLEGVEKCIHPIHEGAANAVGAAIAKVSGQVDVVEIISGRSEDSVLAEARQKAIDLAVQNGAAPNDVRIVEVNKMPLQYTNQSAVRIQIKAVGKPAIPKGLVGSSTVSIDLNGEYQNGDEGSKVKVSNALESTIRPSLKISLETYRPHVRNRVWSLSEVDLQLISTGCGALGTGGGGPTHYEYLKCLIALRSHGPGSLKVISPDHLQDSDSVCIGAMYGSPSVINERIASGDEIPLAVESMRKVLGEKRFQAIMPGEIGGGNGMSAFPTSAALGLPIVDADPMGRAYPTLYHTTFSIYGYPSVPAVLTDARGNVAVIMNSETPQRLETMMRTAAVELGLSCGVALTPRSGLEVRSHGIPNTISLAWYIGRSVHLARQRKTSYVDAIFDVCPGKLLFTGKIVDVHRFIGRGYTLGAVLIGPDTNDESETTPKGNQRQDQGSASHVYIPFQNEYLYAALSDPEASEQSQKVLCTVPDLISILGQDGEAIGSQDLRYGLHVSVIAMPAHPLWKTEKALKIGGPEGFGLKMPPCGIDDTFAQSRSVVEEYDYNP